LDIGTFLLQPSATWAARENALMCDNDLFFIGPNGKQIKLAQLPPRGLRRWRPHHKAMVVAAVRHGLITVEEACGRYNLSTEEYLSWYRCYAPQRPEEVD
jgi:hypothetical protein